MHLGYPAEYKRGELTMSHRHRVNRSAGEKKVIVCSDTYPTDLYIYIVLLYLDCFVFPSLEAPERL